MKRNWIILVSKGTRQFGRGTSIALALVLVCMFIASPAAADLPQGLVAWWAGEGNANDSVGSNHGILYGSVGFANGKLGQAFSLNGGYVHFGLMNEYFGTADFTVDWWMRTDQTQQIASVLGKRSACWAVPMLDIRMRKDNDYHFIDGELGVEVRDCCLVGDTSSGVSMNDGIWHHVAVVRQAHETRVYVDGIVTGTAQVPSGQTVNIFGNTPFYLADSPCADLPSKPNVRYVGEIDELHFFNRALSSAEILSIASPAPVTVTVAGTVTAGCGTQMAGVPVDLVHPDGELHCTVTNGAGYFEFLGLPAATAEATLSLSVPLGYSVSQPPSSQLTVPLTEDIVVPFTLACLAPAGTARGLGYWKHQVNVFLKNKGNAQETLEDMETVFPQLLFNHFHENTLNAIVVEGVTFRVIFENEVGQPGPLNLAAMSGTFNPRQARMEERAKQHYLACLLNMASGRIMTHTEVSEDGKTASQALQYVAALILGDPSGHELAKDIAETMNDAQLVGAGVIPETYDYIAYSRPTMMVMTPFLRVIPNPARGAQAFQFYLAEPGMVRLEVFDVGGRLVWVVKHGVMDAGIHALPWEGSSRGSGIYFARFRGPGLDKVVKFINLR